MSEQYVCTFKEKAFIMSNEDRVPHIDKNIKILEISELSSKFRQKGIVIEAHVRTLSDDLFFNHIFDYLIVPLTFMNAEMTE